MIELRLVQNDTAIRYFRAQRDQRAAFLQTVEVRLRCPSGATKVGPAAIEDGSAGEFRVSFGAGTLTLTEAGQHWLEFFFNAHEHGEEPISVWVRPEYKEGPE